MPRCGGGRWPASSSRCGGRARGSRPRRRATAATGDPARATCTASSTARRVASAQVKSALLLAGLFADGDDDGRRAGAHARPHRAHAAAPWAPTSRSDGLRDHRAAGQTPALRGRARCRATSRRPPSGWCSACCTRTAEIRVTQRRPQSDAHGLADDPASRWARDVELENERDVAGEPVADLVARSSQLRGTTVGGRPGAAGDRRDFAGRPARPVRRRRDRRPRRGASCGPRSPIAWRSWPTAWPRSAATSRRPPTAGASGPRACAARTRRRARRSPHGDAVRAGGRARRRAPRSPAPTASPSRIRASGPTSTR